jgi:hypothetical protein
MCAIANMLNSKVQGADARGDHTAADVHETCLKNHRERCGVCKREAEIDAIRRQGGKVLWADGNVWMVR